MDTENKIVYKRTIFSLLKGIIGAPFAGICAIIVCGMFITENMNILFCIGGGITLLILYITIFSEHIRLEADDRELRYYKRGKLRKTYALDNISVGYRTKVQSGLMGNEDLTLRIYVIDEDRETTIDCSPIGLRKFHSLYEHLDANAVPREEEVLRAE